MQLNYCPFCGCEDIEMVTRDEGNMDQAGFGWMAQCICTHCQAQGSYNGGCETEEDARETAIENWNEAGRKLTWYDHVFQIWDELIYRFEDFIDRHWL